MSKLYMVVAVSKVTKSEEDQGVVSEVVGKLAIVSAPDENTASIQYCRMPESGSVMWEKAKVVIRPF